LTLLGILRIGEILETCHIKSVPIERLREYSTTTLDELDWVANYVAACYRSFNNLRVFAAMSMFYFAAASYAEIARRIGKSGLAPGFLRAGDPAFREGLGICVDVMDRTLVAPSEANLVHLEQLVADILEPINIAGLCDRSKKNWYPVDLADVVNGAPKL